MPSTKHILHKKWRLSFSFERKTITMNYEFKTSSEKAYPPIMTEGENEKYAKILMRLYAGHDSELTLIDQYIYQNIILSEEYKNIASALEKIAITEMKHFKILGSLIKELGADPRIIAPSGSRRGCFWSGEYVNYTRSAKDMLKADIIAEKYSIRDYNNACEIIEDIYIRDIINRIIEDERKHVKIMSDLLYNIL